MTYQPDIRIHKNGEYYNAAWKDSTGKLRRRGLGSCLKKAKKMRDAMIAEHAVHPGARDMNTSMRLSQWLTRYLQLRKPDVEPSTFRDLKRTCDLLFEYFGSDDAKMGEITGDRISDFRLWLTSREPGFAIGTLSKYAGIMKNIFNRAVSEGVIVKSPAAHIQIQTPTKDEPPKWVTEEQLHIVATTDRRLTPLFGLCYYAGLRVNEALRLRWDDVNFEEGKILVRSRQGRRTTKQGTRVVKLEKDLAGWLRLWRDVKKLDGDLPELICSEVPANYQRAVANVMNKYAEHMRFTLKDLRAMRSMIWMKEGIPANVVCKWMGHDPKVAFKHYNIVDENYYTGGDA